VIERFCFVESNELTQKAVPRDEILFSEKDSLDAMLDTEKVSDQKTDIGGEIEETRSAEILQSTTSVPKSTETKIEEQSLKEEGKVNGNLL